MQHAARVEKTNTIRCGRRQHVRQFHSGRRAETTKAPRVTWQMTVKAERPITRYKGSKAAGNT